MEGSSSIKEPGAGHEGPADGQDLLLAAAQGAPRPGGPLLEDGEALANFLQVPAHLPLVPAVKSPQFQVGGDAQGAEDPAAFRHQGQAQGDDALRRHTGEVLAGELNGPLPGRQQPGNGPQSGGFAGAVAADEGHHLSGAHMQRDALEHRQSAIPGLNAF